LLFFLFLNYLNEVNLISWKLTIFDFFLNILNYIIFCITQIINYFIKSFVNLFFDFLSWINNFVSYIFYCISNWSFLTESVLILTLTLFFKTSKYWFGLTFLIHAKLNGSMIIITKNLNLFLVYLSLFICGTNWKWFYLIFHF
jgi:hypothetical protein